MPPVVLELQSVFEALDDGDLLAALTGPTRQRQAVERAFSRLKGQRSLNRITVRRRRKVTVHCYLSLIAMQASPSALGAT